MIILLYCSVVEKMISLAIFVAALTRDKFIKHKHNTEITDKIFLEYILNLIIISTYLFPFFISSYHSEIMINNTFQKNS